MKLSIHIDGGARGNPGPAAAAVVVRRDDGPAQLLHEAAYHLGNASNNVAEYSALLRALNLAVTLKAQEVVIHSDSELMVRQITGQYRVRSPDLLPLFEEAQALLLKLDTWQIKHVYREQNRRADELVNLALDAGRNVVVKSATGETAAPATAPAAAPPNAGSSAPVPRPAATAARENAAGPHWTASLEADPGATCPARCRPNQHFGFGPATPPGFCIHAAQAVLISVNLDGEIPVARLPRQATCDRCGVKIRLDF